MLRITSLAFALTLASRVVGAPILAAVLASVEASLVLPNTIQTNNATYFWQNGIAGACGLVSLDSDLVVGLPLEFYNATGSVSPYCGTFVVVTNVLNNATAISRVADASATSDVLSLSIATYRALDGDATDLQVVTWRFASETQVADAKASILSAQSTTLLPDIELASAALATSATTEAPVIVAAFATPTTTQATTVIEYASVTTTSISTSFSPTTTSTATSPSASTGSSVSDPASYTSTTYWTKTWSGVATHFPGAASALACGDVYDSPVTTKFAALCHSTFDTFPGTTADQLLNENRAPVCGAFSSGQKGLTGAWLTSPATPSAYVLIGGDGLPNCFGTIGVKCHTPRTITITQGGTVVSNVMVVDRNQGLGTSPCAEGDVDVSDAVYLALSGGSVLGSELQGATWVWDA